MPRPEYPRPDRQRGRVEGIDWLNLNGPWQFRFDLHRTGIDDHWPDPLGPDWPDQIIVPFCWESLAAWAEGDAAGSEHYYSTRCYLNPLEVTKANHRSAPRYEVGWYRRHLDIPTHGPWRDKRVILTLGAADFFTDCWCNGIHLGHHEGGYLPFEFDLTATLAEPDARGWRHAVIVIRVEDPMDHREQPVGKQWGWYTTTSGIWQTVFVEPRSVSHIDHFRIFPDIDHGRVAFEVTCHDTAPESQVTVDIIPPGSPAFTIELATTHGLAIGDAEIDPVVLWETGSPLLYRVVFTLRDAAGGLLDEVRGYFGMRKISSQPADDAPAMLCLNNKPIYLRGALYQGYHPDGVYTPREASVFQADIAYALAMGFDFLRIHIKLEDPLLLYYADTLGILLMQDLPNFGEGGDTPNGRRRFEHMMRDGLQRDFNHPSIISWCIFNETWGFGGQNELMKVITPALTNHAPPAHGEIIANSSAFQWVHEMWQLAKQLDPTRLIEDMSVVVWEHLMAYGHVDTDVNSWHFYINDYHKAKAHIEEVVAKTYQGSTFNYISGYSQRNVPLISSEYGGVGAMDGDIDVSWTFKFLTNELRRHGQLSAYVYTQLMDVEWEKNGFLNYDRTPKDFGYNPILINQGDVLPIHAAPISQVAPGQRVEVEVLSSHFSRRRRDGITFHWRYSGIDSLATLHPNLARGYCRIPFRHHRVESARILQLDLPAEPMLCTLAVTAITPDGHTIASNFIQHFVCNPQPLPDRVLHENRLILRRKVSDWNLAEWTGGHCSPAEAESHGACSGSGSGFFEWDFTDPEFSRLATARTLIFLLEASARRHDSPQTDSYTYPSDFILTINGLPVLAYQLPDHPHDTRGALSYLRGGRGAYGYLLRATVEHELLAAIAQQTATDGRLHIRASVGTMPAGGLTVYAHDCGRYPVPPTLVIQWPATAADHPGTVTTPT